jgi:serine/threonine-protein kinase
MGQCYRFRDLDKKLPSILSGETKPTDLQDVIAWCEYQRLNVAGARFLAINMVNQPVLENRLESSVLYSAACFAALAASGQGKDAEKLTDRERADFRKQALQWLREDLTAWGDELHEYADKARPVVQGEMTQWKQVADLAGVRDAKALAKLPPDERDAWQDLWMDVDALLAKTQKKK